MHTLTNSTIDPLRQGVWAVVADWMGADRVVFTGNVFECTRWVHDNS